MQIIQYQALSFSEAAAMSSKDLKVIENQAGTKYDNGMINHDYQVVKEKFETIAKEYAQKHSNNENEFNAIYNAVFFGMQTVVQHPEHIMDLAVLMQNKNTVKRYKVGDQVFVRNHEVYGTVIAVHNEYYRIEADIDDKRIYTCLEDDLEPVYNIGDKARINGMTPVRAIVGRSKQNMYQLAGKGFLYLANDLEIVD